MKPKPRAVVSLLKLPPLGGAEIGLKTVTGYRLYTLDGVNKVSSAQWIEADDDQAAIEVAETLMDGHDCELWQGPRLITRLKRKRGD